MRIFEHNQKFLMIFFVMGMMTLGYSAEISGELKQWHKVTLTFDGPEVSEYDEDNPFLNYRLNVTFKNGDSQYIIPGYFAADGNAAETSAKKGNQWVVLFTPDKTGEWSYEVVFEKGKNIAVKELSDSGTAIGPNGEKGTFTIKPTDKSGKDFRSKGKVRYVGERYLKFAGSGEYFLKGGADSPENFLGYLDFDDTFYGGDNKQRSGEDKPNSGLHKYEAHLKDWTTGDPTWQNGKGKEIIGALNYLSSKGMNVVYMLTNNVMGDGDDVWPWTDYNERYRFDVSKLAQWEIVFSHMDKLGLMCHFVLQETENELLLDMGQTKMQRKLYLRELVARFSHHLAITWNLGEENGPAHWTPHAQDDNMRKAMADYLKHIDPYKNLIVIHTHADKGSRDKVLTPLLGHQTLDGISLQVGDPKDVHDVTLDWIKQSADTTKTWVVTIDEIGSHTTGVKPDADDFEHDAVRKYPLWGNLMAGGAGVEWYFGYKFAHADLNCEDWRSRDHMWDLTGYALEFFNKHLPFHKMVSRDELLSTNHGYCFAKEGEVYAVYLREGGTADLDLGQNKGSYSVRWYNPRKGGKLVKGTVSTVKGPGKVNIGRAKKDVYKDWAVLIKKISK